MSIGLGSKVLLPFFAPFMTLFCPIKVQMLRLIFSMTTLRYTLPIVIMSNQHLIMLHLSHKGSISVKVKYSMSPLGTNFKVGVVKHYPFACTWEVSGNFLDFVKNGTENKSVAL